MSSLSSIQIQALVREMDASIRRHRSLKNSQPDKFYKQVMEENKTLYDVFPTIFDKHIDGKLDATFFEMLKLRHKIDIGEMSEDDASKLIGQQLFDRFVAPVIGNKPEVEKPLSYSEYYKQFETTPSKDDRSQSN
jgi:hypothetical protein